MSSFFKKNSILFINSIILLGLFAGIANLKNINITVKNEKINTTSSTTNTNQDKKILSNDSAPLEETLEKVNTSTFKNKTITQPKINTQTRPPTRSRNNDEESFDD